MNVIVIACNGFHLGFLGCYGNAWIETPNLDRLAAEGTVFDHHYAENLTTLPTRRSWWTGRYSFFDPDAGWTALRAAERILPDYLWNHGVRSALISDVPYLREPEFGFGRGFDEIVWSRGAGYDPAVPPGDPRLGKQHIDLAAEPGLRLPPEDDSDRAVWIERWEQLLRNRVAFGTHQESGTIVARTVDAAINWIERCTPGTTPFCLWLDLFSPHGPWDLPEADRDRYATAEPDAFELGEEGDLADDDADDAELADLAAVTPLIDIPPGAVGDVLDEAELLRLRRTYAGAVTLLDRQLGRFLDCLRKSGRLDDTLVIFTADQGEPLGEHGYVRRFRPWLYEELIHTPLIVRLDGGRRGGGRHQAIVQTVDLFPTILAALGIPPAESVHGFDILPLVRGEQAKLRDYACLGMDTVEYALRTHHWHLILPIDADPEDQRTVELYRKPEDRWDQNDVAAQFPEVAEHLELTLRRFAHLAQYGDMGEIPALRPIARFSPG